MSPLARSIAAAVAELAAFSLLFVAARPGGRDRPMMVGALLALACIGQPAVLVSIPAVAVYLAFERPRAFLPFLLTALALLAAAVLVFEQRWRVPFPPHARYTPLTGWSSWLPVAFAALALLPQRRTVARVAVVTAVLELALVPFSDYAAEAALVAAPLLLAPVAVARARFAAAALATMAIVVHAHGALARTPLPEPVLRAPVVIDRTTAMSDPGVASRLVEGFGALEGAYRWTEGARAVVWIDVPPLPARRLTLRFSAYLARGKLDAQHVNVSIGGRPIARWIVRDEAPRAYAATIPASVPAGRDALTFDLPDAVSPSSVGDGEDARRLAIAVYSIRLESEGTPR